MGKNEKVIGMTNSTVGVILKKMCSIEWDNKKQVSRNSSPVNHKFKTFAETNKRITI